MSRIDEARKAAAVAHASQLQDVLPPAPDIYEEVDYVLRTFFRALYGCKQCGGTGKIAFDYADYHTGEAARAEDVPCPAEHVTLTILGVEIQADPAMCEWRHTFVHAGAGGMSVVEPTKSPWACDTWGCPGWVPRPITELEER